MRNDLDLQLSHSVDQPQNLIEQRQFETDFLLQPITTQEKFNFDNHVKKSLVHGKIPDLTPFKQFQLRQEENTPLNIIKNNQNLASEARMFRQYLNDKVQQLRKSKQKISLYQNSSSQTKSKLSNLRKIITNEELKLKQDKKSSLQHLNDPKSSNIVNKTTQQIQKPEQVSTLSASTNKNMFNRKQEHLKKFSNSQQSLSKIAEKKNTTQSKNITINNIKKSLNLDLKSKVSKLPELVPKLKLPFPQKKQSSLDQQPNDRRKNTIDEFVPKQPMLRQKRKTPQSKSSFRIKRTSNASNQQPSQNKISIQINRPTEKSHKINRPTEKSHKIIEKQNQKLSPFHQGKNKKMREEFIRFNEVEIQIQEQILKHHHQTKKILDQVMKKYQLSINAFEKYGIKKETDFANDPHQVQKQSPKKQAKQSLQDKMSRKQIPEPLQSESPLKKQQRKNKFLIDEIQKINNLLKVKQKNAKNYQNRVEKNALMQFLKSMPQDIMEESDEEVDNVQQMQAQIGAKMDQKYDSKVFSSTYSTVMSQMKKKKWGLKQRITFETHRDHNQHNEFIAGHRKSIQIRQKNLQINKKIQQKSRLPEGINQQEINGPESKIEVNSRLKNLLLD